MTQNSSHVSSGNSKIDKRLAPAGRRHLLLGNVELAAQVAEAHVMAVFLHRDAAGEPLGIGRRRKGDGGLVEDLRAVKLVDGVAAHDLANGGLVLGRLRQGGD